MTNDPEILLALPLIPAGKYIDVKGRIPPITKSQTDAIRNILCMRKDQPWARCPSRSRKKVNEFEAAGDFSHSKKNHCCDLCRCTRVAGSGTKGDFYGLGPGTGHYGAWWCRWCQEAWSIAPAFVLQSARRHVELIQVYGAVSMDKEYDLKLMEAEAEEALVTTKVRDELQMVQSELQKFGELAVKRGDEGWPQEYVMGVLSPASEVTVTKLKLDIAKALSGIKSNAFKMDEMSYLHKDELTRRMPEMMNLITRCLAKLQELVVKQQVRGEDIETSASPLEYVKEMAKTGMKLVWKDAKPGRAK